MESPARIQQRVFRVAMREDLYERLLEWAAEERTDPKALASVVLERAARRWKPKSYPRQAA
jgi:hypothetical protein